MTLAQLKQNILAYADFLHKYNADYSACLKQATNFYLRISFKRKPSSLKFLYFMH
jgi:hypothetical protein